MVGSVGRLALKAHGCAHGDFSSFRCVISVVCQARWESLPVRSLIILLHICVIVWASFVIFTLKRRRNE